VPERRETDRTTSHVVGRNVGRFRNGSGMTTRALATRLTELGVPLTSSGISDIEAGRRTVSVDQLTSLAMALDVSPIALLMPESGPENDHRVKLTGTPMMLKLGFLPWLRGDVPLDPNLWDDPFEVEAFRRRSLPEWSWKTGGSR
jgi:transcriptional regulator with XRE-family HTH domain